MPLTTCHNDAILSQWFLNDAKNFCKTGWGNAT